MQIFWAILLPTFFVSLVVLGLLLGYSLWVVFGGLPTFGKKGKKKLPLVTAPSGGDLEAASSLHSTASAKHFSFKCAKQYSLIWQDVKLEVGGNVPGRPTKIILRGVSGAALPGELVALVGPSGAGKSTLLDILAMRLRPTSGSIMVGGRRQNSKFRTISSYVPQESCFVPTLTVWETMSINASLRIARKVDKTEREELMEGILASMGLLKVKNSRVGGVLGGGFTIRGLSGGEQRRLHISCGIVAAPSIIFLDEPTSGLDSHAALVLMQHLQYLAQGGRTIISSVHQPRQAIWDMFDKLELLSEGHLMFYGPVHEATDWFRNSLGYSYSVEKNGLSADWLMDLVSIGFHNSLYSYGFKSMAELTAASEKFRDQLVLPTPVLASRKGSAAFELAEVDALGASTSSSLQTEGETGLEPSKRICFGLLPARTYPTPFWNQLRWLMWRNLLAYLRNPADVAGRLIMYLFIGLVLGLVFLQDRRGGELTAIQLMLIIFFTLIPNALQPFTQMSIYLWDRQFYLDESASNLYSPLAYYTAQNLVSLPFTIATTQALWLTMYGFMNLANSAYAIIVSMIAQSVISVLGFQVVSMFSFLLPNQDSAMLACITHATMNILLAGFVVHVQDLIPLMRVVSYVMPMRFTYQIMMRLQLESTSSESMLVYSGITWGIGANFLALFLLMGLNFILGYATVVYLKRSKMRR
eukprot:jgi/Botrbrau1/22928/Bobra.0030s0006.1